MENKDLVTINDCILFWQLNHTIYNLKPMSDKNNQKNTIDFFVKELKDSVLLNNSSNHHIGINMYNISELNPLTDIKGNIYPDFKIKIHIFFVHKNECIFAINLGHRRYHQQCGKVESIPYLSL